MIITGILKKKLRTSILYISLKSIEEIVNLILENETNDELPSSLLKRREGKDLISSYFVFIGEGAHSAVLYF